MADLKALRKLFGAIETDQNPDAEHEVVKSGIHKGTRALGEIGLMPQTSKLLANRSVRDTGGSNLDKIISQAPVKNVNALLEQNPEKYEQYGESLLNQVSNSSNGDPVAAYFRWRWGQNLSDEQVNNLKKQNPDVIQRINDKILEQHSSSQPQDFTDTLKQPVEEQLYSKIRQQLTK